MKILRVLTIFIFIYGITSAQLQANAQAVVEGQLISMKTNYPAPGLTVVLLHQNLGRSIPVVSNGNGYFIFYNIPLMQTPYYMEIYWGNQLIHRTTVFINNYRISLPPLYI